MPARVNSSKRKDGYRYVTFNVKDGKFYTDEVGDQFNTLIEVDSSAEVDAKIANHYPMTQSEAEAFINQAVAEVIGAAPDSLNTLEELADALNDDEAFFNTVQQQIDTAVAPLQDATEVQGIIDTNTAGFQNASQVQTIIDTNTANFATVTDSNNNRDYAINNSQGYFFQNSHYFSDGLNHDTNPDVVEDVDAEVETTLKFSDTTTGESGAYLTEDLEDTVATNVTHMYNRSTGVITLKGVTAPQFIIIRLQVDLVPDSDNSSANICMRCTANGASGGFTFDIEEQLASLDQGADIQYPAQITLPIFIGSTLAENPSGSPATITPIVKFTNTSGDIKPRSLAVFFWS